MSNYPPTPAFGGGFSIPRFPKPPTATVPVAHALSSIPGIHHPPPKNDDNEFTVHNEATKGDIAMTDIQGDREEGELSDREDRIAPHSCKTLLALERPSQTKPFVYTKAPNSVQHNNPKNHLYQPSNTQDSQYPGMNLKELREQAKHAVLALLPILSREDFQDEGVNMDVLRNLLRELNMLEHFERSLNGCLLPPPLTTTEHAKSTQHMPFTERSSVDHLIGQKQMDVHPSLHPSQSVTNESYSESRPAVDIGHIQEHNKQSHSGNAETIGGRKVNNVVSKTYSTDAQTGFSRTEEEKTHLQLKLRKRMEEMKTLPKFKPASEPPPHPILAYRQPDGPLTPSAMSLEHGRIISPIVPSTTPQMMIPGLLLDSKDLGISIPETPMAPATPTENSLRILQHVAKNQSLETLHKSSSSNMPEVASENRVPSRRKRPVAADFDSMSFSQPYLRRKFGALDCNPVILEITDDEDEEVNSEHREDVSGRYDWRESSDHSSKNSSTPTGGHEQDNENRRVSPAAAAVSAKRMLDSKEEEIRKLKERILQYEKKKRESSNVYNNNTSANSTTIPTRVSTPVVIPDLNIEGLADAPSISSTESSQATMQEFVFAPISQYESVVLPSSNDNQLFGPLSSLPLDHTRTYLMSTSTPGEIARNPVNSTGGSIAFPSKGVTSMKLLRSKSPISTKQSEEVERLRKLLISKRKAAEEMIRSTDAPNTAETQDAKQSDSHNIEDNTMRLAVTSDVNIEGITSSIDTLTSTRAPKLPQKPDAISISGNQSGSNESGPFRSVQSVEYTTKPSDKPEDLKEDVGAETLKLVQGSNHVSEIDSPAPSTQMDLDNDSSEDGEINEDVEMDVDSDDGSFHITTTTSQSGLDSALSENSVIAGDEDSGMKKPATHNGSRLHPFNGSSTTAVKLNDQIVPSIFSEYQSPLRNFRSFRYHPQYLHLVKGGWRSLTFSNRIDADKPFCFYELTGGICNDTSCESQHFRQIVLSDDEILVELGSVMEGDTDTIRNSYRDGLRESISNMRARKVNDFETVAAEIASYRSRFLADPTRVIRLTKS